MTLKTLVAGMLIVVAIAMPMGPAYGASKEQPLLSKGTRTVLRTGLYGALAGTAVGVIAFPFTQKVRTVFIGTSSGLYLGLALGLFLAWEQSEPEDYSVSVRESKEAPRTHASELALSLKEPPLLYTQLTVWRF
jgi:hypothetical protein